LGQLAKFRHKKKEKKKKNFDSYGICLEIQALMTRLFFFRSQIFKKIKTL
jgi:hypothetical protein